MKKKYLRAVLLVLTLVSGAAMAGCSNKNSEQTVQQSGDSADDTATDGLSKDTLQQEDASEAGKDASNEQSAVKPSGNQVKEQLDETSDHLQQKMDELLENVQRIMEEEKEGD